MKSIITLTSLVLTLLFTVNALANDDSQRIAASNAVTCLTEFYSNMANLPTTSDGKASNLDCKNTLAFILANKAMLIDTIARAGAGSDIAQSNGIIQSMSLKNITGLGYTTILPRAMDRAYYDEITNHRYIKINDNTYAEYTRKGDFFQNVSSSQPHLAKSRYVHPVSDNDFFLYVKQEEDGKQYLTLPVQETHPQGWILQKALVALD